MSYTIGQLSKLSGVSPRALRYYEDLNLLKPQRSDGGYRLYGPKEVDILQQILLYRKMGIALDEVSSLIKSPGFDEIKALKDHLQRLLEKQEEIQGLIATVECTIEEKEGRCKMLDKDKFEGFKTEVLEENERIYGEEIRRKYGNHTVEQSNKKWQKMTKDQHQKMEELEKEIKADLEALVLSQESPASDEAIAVAIKHKAWLNFTWERYTSEAHLGLGEMYIADLGFRQYYDQNVPGCALFLRNAIKSFVENEK